MMKTILVMLLTLIVMMVTVRCGDGNDNGDNGKSSVDSDGMVVVMMLKVVTLLMIR